MVFLPPNSLFYLNILTGIVTNHQQKKCTMVFTDLSPQELWNYFYEVTQVPRPSKKEEKIIDYLIRFGKMHVLETKRDSIGNVLIKKPATPGFEGLTTVILQSHIDMVCEKHEHVDHDFENDPIILEIHDNWVKAKGTTLGADDGIGMAAQLAILASNDIQHGPLECLFTVDEETGLTGAFNLQKNFFDGKILINLDSEDEGELFIGCAGGVDTLATMRFSRKTIPGRSSGYKITVSGLKGGHSGDDIEKERGNANIILSRFLLDATKKYDIRIHEFDGGNLRNAIPRYATCTFTFKDEHEDSLHHLFDAFNKKIRQEYASTEPGLLMNLESSTIPDYVINKKTQLRLLKSLVGCPNGVIAMSTELEGLVETSTNLASVKTRENEILITTSQRSSVESRKEYIASAVRSIFELGKANVKHSDGYPGWTPDTNSEILKITESAYQKLFNEKPVVRAIHAGLECGLFLEKYPYLDMISFGPTIKDAHSPNERLHIGSTQKFWDLLLEVLKTIPQD